MGRISKRINSDYYTSKYRKLKTLYKKTDVIRKDKFNDNRIAQSDNINRECCKIIN